MFEPINLITFAPKHTIVWIGYISEKVNSVANVVYSRLMYFKAHFSKKCLNLASESVCFTFVPAKKNHVVLQTDVALAFECVLNEHIQAIEHDICVSLAQWYSERSANTCVRKRLHRLHLRVHELLILEYAKQSRTYQIVDHVLVKFLNVQL